MDFALYRRPGPLETSFSALLQRAMRGKLFPDIIQHYERVELETRAMIISDWMMTLYTDVLFKVRNADSSTQKQNYRVTAELVEDAQNTQQRNSRMQLFAAQSLKDHFNWILPQAEQHRRRRQDDYEAFLAKRRELSNRHEAARLLQRVGRGKLWRVLLFVSKTTRRDGLTTRSLEWEDGFNQLLAARRLVANAAYKKQVTDSAIDYAKKGASDDRVSLSTAKKLYFKYHEERKAMEVSSDAFTTRQGRPSTPFNPSPKKADVLPFRLLAAPWSWTVRRDELEERAKKTLEFIIAEEKLNRWSIWKSHIRDLVLKQEAIPRNKVEFEMRKVWKTIEIESIALSQRAQMHKDFLKSLTVKYHQYRRERAELKESLIRKGVLFPDEGIWDYDLQDEPEFTFGEGLSPFRLQTDRQRKRYRRNDDDLYDDNDDDHDGTSNDDNETDRQTETTKDTLRHGRDSDTSSVMQGQRVRLDENDFAQHPHHHHRKNSEENKNQQNNNITNNNESSINVITTPTDKPPMQPNKNSTNNNNAPSMFGNLGNAFNRPGSASNPNSRPGSGGDTPVNNNNNNMTRKDSLIPAGTNPFSRPGSGASTRTNSANANNNRYNNNSNNININNNNNNNNNTGNLVNQNVFSNHQNHNQNQNHHLANTEEAQDSVFEEILERKRRKEERAKWKRFEKSDNNNNNFLEDDEFDEEIADSEDGLGSIDSKASIRAKKQVWI